MIGKLLLRRRGNMVRPLVTETGALVQCNPVPDSVLGIKSYFSPVETPPAEGEKSPTNPSTISGWESVEVTRCGKNLFDFATERTSVSEAISAPDSGLFLELMFKKGIRNCSWSADVKTSKTATGSMYSLGQYRILPLKYVQASPVYKRFNLKGELTYLQDASVSTYGGFSFYFIYDSGAIPTTKNYQFEIGTTPTPYTPYQGNTYTATFPSEVSGGFVDWERGVLITEWYQYTLTEATPVYIASDKNYFGVTSLPSDSVGLATISSHFKAKWNNSWGNTYYGRYFGNVLPDGGYKFDTVSAFKTWYLSEQEEGRPVTVTYKQKTPIETPLSDLPTIYAIDGINTIYSNAGDVEVTYKGAR